MNINENKMKKEVMKWKTTNKMSRKLTSDLLSLAKSISNKAQFENCDREDLIQSSLERVLKYGNKFNDSGKAFSYFYKLIYNSMINKLTTENKEKILKNTVTKLIKDQETIDYSSINIFDTDELNINFNNDKIDTVISYNYSEKWNYDNVTDIDYYIWLLYLWCTVCGISYRQVAERCDIGRDSFIKMMAGKKISQKILKKFYNKLNEEFQIDTLKKLPIYLKLVSNWPKKSQ